MIDGKRVLGLVCARGGSKGVPRKNLRKLGGRPLVAWSIASARACPLIDRVILSTDDAEIAETAKAFGAEVPFLRPAELARDPGGVEAVRNLADGPHDPAELPLHGPLHPRSVAVRHHPIVRSPRHSVGSLGDGGESGHGLTTPRR